MNGLRSTRRSSQQLERVHTAAWRTALSHRPAARRRTSLNTLWSMGLSFLNIFSSSSRMRVRLSSSRSKSSDRARISRSRPLSSIFCASASPRPNPLPVWMPVALPAAARCLQRSALRSEAGGGPCSISLGRRGPLSKSPRWPRACVRRRLKRNSRSRSATEAAVDEG